MQKKEWINPLYTRKSKESEILEFVVYGCQELGSSMKDFENQGTG